MLPVPGQYPSPFPKPPAITSPVPTEAIVQASTMPPFIEHDQQVTPLWKLSSFNRKKIPAMNEPHAKNFAKKVPLYTPLIFSQHVVQWVRGPHELNSPRLNCELW